ncbi:N-acetylglucosamine-1-phosphotransferase subunits alpha/beta [Condylostylus longicornis]|uniref:N-acetylglucosamine-1-phosphotransferase subunits alpha/beta n=1 Tax=Condylostylus longicornis TaxID=2530218 RepID=UPI00244E4E4D|nr:N-acetylglucosamine-1-phosphotransferase subunits alpha/beta [Condylostylus longicornis]
MKKNARLLKILKFKECFLFIIEIIPVSIMRFKRLKHRFLDKVHRLKKKILTWSFVIFFVIIIFILMKIQTYQQLCHKFIDDLSAIDVVYTWVNGSDDRFDQSISKYKTNYDITRYDDKNELRFSLRSLEKYAPWVRHVYIVTNGQIPHWLDLSYSKISLITHKELTRHMEILPTFSSSAIETFIHRIPNLSKRFLYLNDDIFLNAELFPEDLYTNSDGVKVYNAWTVPDCATDCPWVYIGDGTCDQHCNIEECQFDGNDCALNDETEENDDRMFDMPEPVFYEVPKINDTTNGSPIRKLKSIKRKTDVLNKGISFKDYIKKSNFTRTFNFTDEKELKDYVEKFNSKQKTKIRTRNINLNVEKNSPESTSDIFMHSLVYTNKLLNRIYGFKSRYVLAHVGFLLDKDIIEEMEKKFSDEILKTAHNRFRSPEDIQFAFLYYNFLMSETINKTVSEIFDEFDSDNSGTLSDREIRTFLTRIYPIPLDWAAVKYAEQVLNNCSKVFFSDSKTQIEYSTLAYERYEDSKMPVISKDLIENCSIFKEAMLSHFAQRNRYKFLVNSKREMHSNFMMLKSNVTDVIISLDKFRRNPKKFNCINDNLDSNMKEENEMVRNLLEDFYISFFPHQSKFELPDHYRNKFLYMEDFEHWKTQKYILLIICYIISAILIGIFTSYLCAYKAKCARKCIELL